MISISGRWRSVGSGAAASRLVQLMPCPPLLCLQAQQDPRQKARHAKHEDLHGPLLSQNNSLKKDSSFAPRRKSETFLTGLCLVKNTSGEQSEPSRRPNAACYAPPRAISASPQLRTLFAIDQCKYHRPNPISPTARANHQNPGGSTRASRITSPRMTATSPHRQRRPLRIKNASRAVILITEYAGGVLFMTVILLCIPRTCAGR